MDKNPKAVAKVREEFDGLTGTDTWDLDSVDEHTNIVHNAKLAGKTVHIADIMSICSRKCDERPKEYHQLKGRIVGPEWRSRHLPESVSISGYYHSRKRCDSLWTAPRQHYD